jgi:uncharacterized protein
VLESLFMHPAIPYLIELQRIDQKIAALRLEIEAFPKRIRDLDARLSGSRTALAAAKEKHAQVIVQRKRAEFDVAEWRERARKFRAQSASVKTNDAFRALQHEIANAEAEIAKAEDRQLEHMMAAEDAEKIIKSAEAALREAEQALASDRQRIEAARAEKQKELDAVSVSREEALAHVPEELHERYVRIAKRHHGVALAEAVHEQCRGCGMRILPHMFQELLRAENHEIFTCETCGRLLYASEPKPAANSNSAAQGAGISS